jgi:hypothetical protein
MPQRQTQSKIVTENVGITQHEFNFTRRKLPGFQADRAQCAEVVAAGRF